MSSSRRLESAPTNYGTTTNLAPQQLSWNGAFGCNSVFDAQDEGGEQVEVLDASATEKGTSASRKAVDPSQRVTTRYMTKYEKARILGTRALQLR